MYKYNPSKTFSAASINPAPTVGKHHPHAYVTLGERHPVNKIMAYGTT